MVLAVVPNAASSYYRNYAARTLALIVLFLSFLIVAGCGGGGKSAFDPAAASATPSGGGGSGGSGGSSGAGESESHTVGPVAPSNARVIDHIEDRKNWGHCSDCAAAVGRKHPPLAHWDFQQHQSTPSLDGSSVRMHVSGSAPYANVLHWTKFDGKTDYQYFLFEFDLYASPESLNAENLEFDLFQGHRGKEFMFGTQCNYQKGIWQGFNGVTHDWIDFPQAPCKKFPAGKWTHVKWLMHRTDDGKVHYVSVTVNDKSYDIGSYQPPVKNGWDKVVGVQFQQDLNSTAADYAIWVDRIKVSMW
jgi:hypothetical protein